VLRRDGRAGELHRIHVGEWLAAERLLHLNANQFATPSAGTFGNLSGNAIRGPDFFTYSPALFKNFAVNENIKLELRGEVYNLTNTTNAVNPITNFSAAGFGASLGNVGGFGGRQFQIAARILF
jgi:hypothetical protein